MAEREELGGEAHHQEGDWVTLKAPSRVKDISRDGNFAFVEMGRGTLWARIEEWVKVAPPEPDWANVPRGTRVEVRDFEDAEWHPATYFGYADGDEVPHIAKVFDGYACWRYCRLVGGEHE